MSEDPRHPSGTDPKVGAFLAPDGVFGIPMRNLSDEIRAGDPKPKAAERPNWIRRVIDRFTHAGH